MRRHPQVLIGPPRGAVTRRSAPRTWRNRSRSGLRGFLPLALAVALAGGLAACKTADEALAPSPPGIGAKLEPTGGSVTKGNVAFKQVDGGVMIAANLGGGTPGQWRVAIHATGICTSPNGFSAGPPLLLPGTALPAAVPVFTNADGTGGISTRLPGLALEGPGGIVGKSVVVHAGAIGSLDAQPGIPNNRVACGVIGPVRSLF
jgi:Cu-Zn family superoxide dismutase